MLRLYRLHRNVHTPLLSETRHFAMSALTWSATALNTQTKEGGRRSLPAARRPFPSRSSAGLPASAAPQCLETTLPEGRRGGAQVPAARRGAKIPAQVAAAPCRPRRTSPERRRATPHGPAPRGPAPPRPPRLARL